MFALAWDLLDMTACVRACTHEYRLSQSEPLLLLKQQDTTGTFQTCCHIRIQLSIWVVILVPVLYHMNKFYSRQFAYLVVHAPSCSIMWLERYPTYFQCKSLRSRSCNICCFYLCTVPPGGPDLFLSHSSQIWCPLAPFDLSDTLGDKWRRRRLQRSRTLLPHYK